VTNTHQLPVAPNPGATTYEVRYRGSPLVAAGRATEAIRIRRRIFFG
jgi:hypothetical protein